MASKIIIKVNNIDKVKAECEEAVERALMICGENWVNHTRDYTPVDTSRLKNSIRHQMKGKNIVEIGTDVEYAVYVEYGENMTHTVGRAHFLRDGGMNHVQEYKKIIETEMKK